MKKCMNCNLLPVESEDKKGSRKIRPSKFYCKSCLRLKSLFENPVKVLNLKRKNNFKEEKQEKNSYPRMDSIGLEISEIINSGGQISISFLQRKFKLNFEESQKIMNEIENLV